VKRCGSEARVIEVGRSVVFGGGFGVRREKGLSGLWMYIFF
jgi:hypothetical protein